MNAPIVAIFTPQDAMKLAAIALGHEAHPAAVCPVIDLAAEREVRR